MSDIKTNLENIKETASATANKVARSETVASIKKSAGDIADKVNNNETVANAKEKVKELSGKIQENEKVAAAMEKVNDNKYVQKAKGSKYGNLIKYGVILVAVILIFNVGKAVFKDKYAAKAEQAVISQEKEGISYYGGTGIKVSAKTIAKNADAHMYLIDLNVSADNNGTRVSNTSFVLVYSDEDGAMLMQEIEYTKETKSVKKEVALSMLSRG